MSSAVYESHNTHVVDSGKALSTGFSVSQCYPRHACRSLNQDF